MREGRQQTVRNKKRRGRKKEKVAKEWRQHRVVEWRIDDDVHSDQMATACFDLNVCLYVMDRRKRQAAIYYTS